MNGNCYNCYEGFVGSEDGKRCVEDKPASNPIPVTNISTLPTQPATPQPKLCCKAMNAECLSCVVGMEIPEYCR